jgi:hypothetical protein
MANNLHGCCNGSKEEMTYWHLDVNTTFFNNILDEVYMV